MERLKSLFRKFYGRYGILFSNMKSPSHECKMTFWLLTNSDSPTNQTFYQFRDLDSEFDLHRIMSGFHGAFVTGVACRQGTLTPPDTWFRPLLGGLHMIWSLRPVYRALHWFNDRTELDLHHFKRSFHGAFATGLACQQEAITLTDTWFRFPFWEFLVLQLLRPDSTNSPCLYSTFHQEYPLVLSRFCFNVLLICVL